MAVVFVTYTAALAVARNEGLLIAMVGGMANTVAIAAVALGLRPLIVRLAEARVWVKAVSHVALAAVFSLVAYWVLTILLGVLDAMSLTEFSVQPFSSRATAWQMLQNVTTYGLFAAVTLLQMRPRAGAAVIAPAEVTEERTGALSRYFIRTGDDIHPIDVTAVISILGADDYAEVVTDQGRHLVRMTLAEFEKALDAEQFIRVHRSRIVNVQRIARAEPAGGGRMNLHMENGELIATSRAGARLLRGRVL